PATPTRSSTAARPACCSTAGRCRATSRPWWRPATACWWPAWSSWRCCSTRAASAAWRRRWSTPRRWHAAPRGCCSRRRWATCSPWNEARGGWGVAQTVAAKRVGPYELEMELGRGAFGVVYRAHHRDRPEAPLAVKVVESRGPVDRLLL